MEKKKSTCYVDDKKYSYSSQKPIASVVVQVNSKNIHLLIKKFRINEKINISFGDIVLNATCRSLKNFPEFNSNFDTELKLYPNINIGYLINLGKGPKTAVIRDADKKSIIELSSKVKELALKYIHGELPDFGTKNSTFSITNLSSFDSYLTVSPIYEHQSSMISITSEFDSFEILEGKVISIKKFNLILSYDARVADCQKALRFLNSIKDILEGKKIKQI